MDLSQYSRYLSSFFPIDKLHLAVQPARKAEVAKVVHCNASKRQKENNKRPDNSHTF